jgi:LacI family transcriptional regulator
MDQSLVTEISTRHLLEQGCQSIGLIDVHSDRIKGYRRALKEADIQIQDHWIYPAAQYTFSYQAGEAAVKYWYESQKMPEGIVGESDAQAMGAINTLKELGLRVPEDVKVTGIDNSPFCEYARPTITSVSQQNQFRGQKAMKAILKLATGKTPNESSIEPVLIPRASSRL